MGNGAETLLFDTIHSGQLSVKRLGAEARPLLQLGMPLRAPDDPPPAGIALDSEFVQAGFQQMLCSCPLSEPSALAPTLLSSWLNASCSVYTTPVNASA